jgi:hypothetical protein
LTDPGCRLLWIFPWHCWHYKGFKSVKGLKTVWRRCYAHDYLYHHECCRCKKERFVL